MYHSAVILGISLAMVLAMFFSSLTFALRDFSRTRLEEWLKRHGKHEYYERTLEHAEELAFITAMLRLFCNIVILLGVLAMLQKTNWNYWAQYVWAFLISGVVSSLVSVAIPLAIARHAGPVMIGACIGFIWFLHAVMTPAVAVMQGIDRLVGKATGPQTEEQEQQAIEEQILTAVEEGEKEGVVDEQEREMIKSVIEFGDVTAREVMTARADVVAIDAEIGLTMVREVFEKTGHSRIPVFEQTLDHIIGVLYARDLLRFIGENDPVFDIRKVARQAFFVPETKLLSELLRDFRLLKIHMAVVLDEYGGTAGLVTIEDVLEELVGEISDEHEPQEPAMLKKIDEHTWEVDARLPVSELNATLGIALPEDPEVHTIGGLVATSIGRIPEKGAMLSLGGTRVVVIDAEPQRINRIRMELLERTDDAAKGKS